MQLLRRSYALIARSLLPAVTVSACTGLLTRGTVAASDIQQETTCSVGYEDPIKSLLNYDAVFIGRVIAMRIPTEMRSTVSTAQAYFGPIEVELDVVRAWKGSLGAKVTVVTGTSGTPAFRFDMMRSFFVSARRNEGTKSLEVSWCDGTRPLEKADPAAVEALDRLLDLQPAVIPPTPPALNCCCGVAIVSAKASLADYDTVLIGDVVESESCSKEWVAGSVRGATGCRDVRLIVHRGFHGEPRGELVVREGGCGNWMELGHRYLVWARHADPSDPAEVMQCATGEVGDSRVAEYLKELDAPTMSAPSEH